MKLKITPFPESELPEFNKELQVLLDKHSVMLVAEPQIVIKRVEKDETTEKV